MGSTRNTKKVVSQIGIALLTFSVLKLLGRLLFDYFELLPANDNPWMEYLNHVLPIYTFGFLAYLIAMRFIPNGTDKREKEKLKISHIFLVYFAANGLDMAINGPIIGIINVLSKFTPIDVSSTTDSLANDAGLSSAFAGLILGAMVAGFGEEFICRKLLYKKMAGCPDIYYILVSGITFGIMHDYFTMGIGHCVVGMMFAYIYLRTRSYLTVALLHMLTDSVSFFFLPIMKMISVGAWSITGIGWPAIGIIVMVYALIRRRKEFGKHLRPALEDGWEFAEGKWPLKAVFSNLGIALFTVWCFGWMIRHLFKVS